MLEQRKSTAREEEESPRPCDLVALNSVYPIWTFRWYEVLICRESWQRVSNGKLLESHFFSHHRGDS